MYFIMFFILISGIMMKYVLDNKIEYVFFLWYIEVYNISIGIYYFYEVYVFY